MAEKGSNIISTLSALASVATAASMQNVINEFGKPKLETAPFSGLTTTLIAFSSYYFSRRLLSERVNKSTEKKLIEAISRTTLDVKVDSEGQVATTVSLKPLAPKQEVNSDVPQEKIQNVVIERRDGNTYYKIENLHIHLTAEVVHQLNLNPDKVINTIKGELRAESDKIEKMEFKSENRG